MYKAVITIFDKTLHPLIVNAEGSRTSITENINKLLKDNVGRINNININIREIGDEGARGK